VLGAHFDQNAGDGVAAPRAHDAHFLTFDVTDGIFRLEDRLPYLACVGE
jgi:hypothetical protein